MLCHSEASQFLCFFEAIVLTFLHAEGKRREAEDRIKALGGEIVSSEYYEPRCTHVISARPATTEKYLCAVAAGKHVLHPSYIEDSFQQGSFLPVEEYEWCAAVDGMESIDDYGLALAKAPEMWKGRKISARIGRKSVAPLAEEKKSCFDGMVCVVLSSAEKRAGFKRILEAGGAVVCGDLEDRFKTLRKNSSVQDLLTQEARERNRRVTHVFINKEIYEMQYKDWPGHEIREIFPILEDLYDQGAKFLFEDYVVEKIAQNIDLRSKASKVYHVDVDSWMKQNRVPEAKVGNKRKSVHQST